MFLGTPPDAWKDCYNKPCPSPYKWFFDDWGSCSVTCGGGWQRRNVTCAKEDRLPTAYEMCNHTKQPEYQQTLVYKIGYTLHKNIL